MDVINPTSNGAALLGPAGGGTGWDLGFILP
jgi:hypothetical protein